VDTLCIFDKYSKNSRINIFKKISIDIQKNVYSRLHGVFQPGNYNFTGSIRILVLKKNSSKE